MIYLTIYVSVPYDLRVLLSCNRIDLFFYTNCINLISWRNNIGLMSYINSITSNFSEQIVLT